MAFKILKKTDELDYKSGAIANSVQLTVGDAIMPGATTHAAFLTSAINSTSQYTGIFTGVVAGIFSNGKPAEVNTVTVGSDNETTLKYSVEYVPTYIDIEWVVDMSGDLTTTTSSDLMGMFYLAYNTAGHFSATYGLTGQLDETSYAAFTTQLHFFSYGAYKLGNINATTSKYTQVVGKFCSTKTV